MTMPQKTLITSESKQGRPIVDLFKVAFNKAGLLSDEVQFMFERGDQFKQEQIALLHRFAVGCPASCEAAQEILGANFFGIADWQSFCGVQFTKSQLAKVSQFPWNEKVLTASCPFHPDLQVKDTHFAFLGVEYLDKKRPLTIRQWQELCPASGQPRFYAYPPECWYKQEQFATTVTCQLKWCLLLKEIVPGSESKLFNEQELMLPAEYEVPSAVAEAAKDLLCYKQTGVYPNPNRYASTSDVTSDGFRVVVGRCDAKSLNVNFWWHGSRYNVVGVGAARK